MSEKCKHIVLLSSNLVVLVRPTNSYQTYDLQHACSQSITNVISICRHQFCCNNTKGRIEEEAIMLFISIFRSTSTQPCRNGSIRKWFSTQKWFWRKFKLFFSHLFLFLGEINIFQLSALTELQKDWQPSFLKRWLISKHSSFCCYMLHISLWVENRIK